MFCISSLNDVDGLLSQVYSHRLGQAVIPQAPEVRGPIGIFLVRADGATGSKLAQEVVGSFQYWHERTGHFFDAIFLGWGFDGTPAFDAISFNRCIADLEERLIWQYRGGAELLLTDFVYMPAERHGTLDFSRTVPLNISDLLDQKKLQQLGPLIEELRAPSQALRESEAEVSVMQLSDYIALLRTRRFMWNTLVKRIGTLLGWVDEVLPYAVRDLRKAG